MSLVPECCAYLIGPFVALAMVASPASADAEEYVRAYAIDGRANVRLKTTDGDVRLTTWDAPKVEYRVKYAGFTVGKNLHIDTRQDAAGIEMAVRANWGLVIGVSRKRVSFEVLMPRNANLLLEIGDDNADITGVDGEVTVRSDGGDLRLANLSGAIDVYARSGDIAADKLQGTRRLRAKDGKIEAVDLDGAGEITGEDATIRVAGRFDSLVLGADEGWIDARIASGSTVASEWSISTNDGRIALDLARDLKADLDVSTGDGRISLTCRSP